MTHSLSVVIPVYNGAQSLPELTAQLSTVLPTIAQQYEIIFVEDDGKDNSWQVIQQLAAQYAWVRGLKMSRNYGQHNALLAGIRQAQYELIATMDDDLQHPPEELPKLVEALTDQVDVVYGVSNTQQYSGLWRYFATQVTKWTLQGAMGVEQARNISPYRVFRAHLRQSFADFRSPYVSIDALLTWGTTRFAIVMVPHHQRKYGKSNYTFYKLVIHTLNMLTGFSVLPLRVATFVGLLVILFGVAVLLYTLIAFITGNTIQGFPFYVSLITIFAGTQLFVLGIIGEYLARVHLRVMEKPPYTIYLVTDSGETKTYVDAAVQAAQRIP